MSIANGCDMFLLIKNIDEDYYYMKEGYKTEFLQKKRLEEAVFRILATKAAINLKEKKIDEPCSGRKAI
jgi:beta-N-acetylhexosaminidase